MCFLFSIFPLLAVADPGDTLWTRRYGGPGDDRAASVLQASDGTYLLAGYTDSYGSGGKDVWILKLNENGDTIWTRTYGGEDDDEARWIDQTNDGNFIVCGLTSSFSSDQYWDLWLLKISSDGDTIWTKTYGDQMTNWSDEGNCVKPTADGGYIVCGTSMGYDPYGWPKPRIYVVKTDSLGDSLWTRLYMADDELEYTSQCMQPTNDGGYIIAGTHKSYILDGGRDVYLLKINSMGDTLWSKIYSGGAHYDKGHYVIQTADDGYAVAGWLEDDNSQFNFDMWVLKTDQYGDTIWTRHYGGEQEERAFTISTVVGGGYVISGVTRTYGGNVAEAYLVRIDNRGDTLWTRTYGGPFVDCFYSVQPTNDRGYIAAGIYEHDSHRDLYCARISPDPPECITGTVTDPSGSPVESVYVEVIGEYAYDFTDNHGEYWIRYLDTGIYDLKFSPLNFVDTIISDVPVYDDDTTIVDVVLSSRRTKWFVAIDSIYSLENGSSQNPFRSIQVGIDSAYTSDTVYVLPGLYEENIIIQNKNILLASTFIDYSDITMVENTILDGYSSNSVVICGNGVDSNTNITGFTIQNGYSYWGGGINCTNSSPRISYNIIMNNTAVRPGDGGGGGIYCEYSSAIIDNNTIKNNYADMAGAIYCRNSDYVTITKNIIVFNSASLGGAFRIVFSNSRFYNNTIYGNFSSNLGGAFTCAYSYPEFKNCVVWRNQTANSPAIYIENGDNPQINYSDVQDSLWFGGVGNISEDPCYTEEPHFLDPSRNNFQLDWGSPCIDAGDPNSPSDPDGTIADIGATYFRQDALLTAMMLNKELPSLPYGELGIMLPKQTSLFQNYPNPFNTRTRITYALPKNVNVKLDIYNILSQKVETLVNENQQSGFKSVTWDASNYSSGLYYYKLTAGNRSYTKRMILLK